MYLGASPYPLLPDPPILEYYLLESPWQLLLLLFIAGAILVRQGLMNRQRKLLIIGVVSLLLCLPLMIVSSLVKTQRQDLARHVRNVISLTAPLDGARLKPLVTTDCAFYRSAESTTPTLAQAEIDLLLGSPLKSIFREQAIQRIDISLDSPDKARCQVWLKTYLNRGTQDTPPVSTRWELEWTQIDGQWRLSSARWIDTQRMF